VGAGTSPVYVESGSKRVFACSLAWPGLSRSGKTEEAALTALAEYVPRYARVAAQAKLRFDLAEDGRWHVVERVPTRSGGADFGVPTTVLDGDGAPVKAAEASRTASLLLASWQFFDQTATNAPQSLRKGPRGGGRDRDAIVAHVAAAEQMFASKVGVKLPVPKPGDAKVVAANREELLGWCQAGKALDMARPGWPPRYAARRLIWHVLDHLWEIEDRRE
jgi:hypothetical protein